MGDNRTLNNLYPFGAQRQKNELAGFCLCRLYRAKESNAFWLVEEVNVCKIENSLGCLRVSFDTVEVGAGRKKGGVTLATCLQEGKLAFQAP